MVSLKFRVAALIASVALVLAGCQTNQVKSDVSAFSALRAEDAGKRVFIAPYEEADGNSLEWQTYAAMMADKIRAKGYQIAENADAADLVAFLGYAIDSGRDVTSTYSVPQWGVTGYSSSRTTGTVTSYGGGYGTYSGTTTHTPQYGVTGYSTGTRTDTVFTRSMSIDMVDASDGAKKWEMRLSSTGSCGRFQAVANTFLEAAFRSFPSGQGGTEVIDWDGEC